MTPPLPPPDVADPDALRLPALVASQFSYHLRMAAVFALAGESEESASEVVLAWTILSTQCPEAEQLAAGAAGELIDQRVASVSDSARVAATSRAQGLALDIESHFVSVGCQAEATLYATVAEQLETSVADLIPKR